MEDTRAVASWGGIQELINDRLRTVDEVISSINAVAAEDVQRVAQSLLLTEKLNLAIVGPYRSQLQFQPLLKL
jgi:predicted Zn-dependent peptidase